MPRFYAAKAIGTIIAQQVVEAVRAVTVFEEGEVVWVTDTNSFYIGDGVTAGGLFIGTEGGFSISTGTNSDRLLSTPGLGELYFTTDTKKLYIGDGTTVGGILIGPIANELTSNQLNAITNSASPSSSNVFITNSALQAALASASGGAWDWVGLASEEIESPNIDQLGGAVDASKWIEATSFGTNPRQIALTGLSAPASTGSKLLVGHYDSAVTLAVGGIYHITPANDFVYAFRFSVRNLDDRLASQIQTMVAAVYVHSTTTIPGQNWYGAGFVRNNEWIYSGKFGALETSVSNWWTVGGTPSGTTHLCQGDPGVMNVWLRKVTNTIEVYGSIGNAFPMLLKSWSLGVTGSNAGIVGIRLAKSDVSTAAPGFALHAFARVSTVPGL